MRRLVGIGCPRDGGDDRHVPADDGHDDVGRHVDDVDPPTTSTTPATTSSAASTSTVVPTVDPAPTTIAPGPPPEPPGIYPAPGPAVPDQTDPIDPSWPDPATGELQSVADGTYWGTVVGHGGSGPQFVTFKLTQAFFGEACTAQFGADGCDNDVATLEEPSGTMPMFISAGLLTVADPTTQQSYVISGDMLVDLLSDPTGAGTLVPGYVYVPFPYLLHVTGGQIVSAEQVWTP